MISSDNVSSQYAGNNLATSFAYGFPVTDPSQLSVYLTVVATNTITPLTLNADYTVNGVNNTSSATWTITYPAATSSDPVLPTGTNLTIVPSIPLTQLSDFTTQGAFSPQIYEAALDKLTLIDQQQQEQLNRAVTIPVGSTETTDAGTVLAGVISSANAASASATAAAGSATTASTAATTATTQATNAATSATSAATQATNASTSATAAAGSATAANASAAIATTQATNAATSATSASGSATTAGAAATTATTQAANASTSATAAAASAALVQPYSNNQYAASTSSANAFTASLNPAPTTYTTGMRVAVVFTNANTGPATLNLNGLGAKTMQYNGVALTSGQIVAGQTATFIYDGTYFQLLNPTAASSGGFANLVILTAGTSWTIPAGITKLKYVVIGGGGGGGGANGGAGGGGGSGAVATGYLSGLTPGNTLSYAIGAGGTSGAYNAANGTAAGSGGTTTFNAGAISCTGGNGGNNATTGGSGAASGGMASGASINYAGRTGDVFNGAATYWGGRGGDTPLGYGKGGSMSPFGGNTANAGIAGTGYGSGGSGAGGNGTAAAGGAGASGAIILEY